MTSCNSINALAEGEAKRWFVIYTRSRAEKVVEKQLNCSGIDTFLPQIYKASRRKDRIAKYLAPLFPSYLFANLPPTGELLATALSVGGVVNFLRDRGLPNGPPAPVPDSEIDSLKLLITNECVLQHQKYICSGDLVRVLEGPLAGCEGVVVKRNGKSLLVVSIKLMQRSIAVTLEDLCVEKISLSRH
jgi:transcription antitermination factor NusG